MKLTTSKLELQRGLARIQAIVEKRNTMPILANVLLRASKAKGDDDGTLELAATDLEIGIRSLHSVAVAEAGEITVSVLLRINYKPILKHYQIVLHRLE